MDTSIVTTIVSGFFSLIAALGSIWLKHWLETKRAKVAEKPIHATEKVKEEIRARSEVSRSGVVRPILVVIAGLVLGVMTTIKAGPSLHIAQRGFHTGFFAFLVACVLCLALVFIHRRSVAGFWPFQLETFALWAAVLCGYSFAIGRIWEDAVWNTSLIWIGFALVGGILVLATRRRRTVA